jgi:NADH-quinone oxidoreductase subunit N
MQQAEKLEWIKSSIGFVLPELILSIGILVLIVAGLLSKNGRIAQLLSIGVLLTSFLSLIVDGSTVEPVSLFIGMIEVNDSNFYLRLLLTVTGILIALISDPSQIIKNPFEYFTLTLSIVFGAQLLVMSQHFVMIILSLELMSIPAYVLAGFAFDKPSAEATLKYFIYGSVATAFLIFGMTWLYGLSDSLVFTSSGFQEKLKFNDNPLFLGAGLMVIAGLLFKMAATPFHFWAPDVYQVTPMPLLALFSTIPKVAAGAILIKLLAAFTLSGQSFYDWQAIICVLAMATLTVGNFSAIWQKNVKRLMAYSSIGQAGFLLVAIATFSVNGSQFFLFYSTILVISTVLAFLVLEYFERLYQTKNLSDFQGLGRMRPGLAVLLTFAMLSLVGLPVTAGFTAKLFVFSGLLEAWSNTGKSILIWLFAFGLLNTVVSLYYYLQIPYFMFLKESRSNQMSAGKSIFPILLGSLLALFLLWFFFQPDSLMGWINRLNFVPR